MQNDANFGEIIFLTYSFILADVPTDYGKLCFSPFVNFCFTVKGVCKHSNFKGILSFTLKF